MIKRFAFTLAEVLITLAIIGVVAALTIPTLINKYQEKATIVKLKKVYSIFSNAYMLTISENGTPDNWDDIDASLEGVEAFWNRLRPNLKLAKECSAATRFECWDVNDYYKYLNSNEDSYAHIHNGKQITAILPDGIMIAFNVTGTETKPNPGCLYNNNYFACATLTVKTENSKEQIYGKNIFTFRFEHNTFVPASRNADMARCHKYGQGCTAWAIYNNNMDYIRCDDLSWSGKKKCD